jgi:hypothetical protein
MVFRSAEGGVKPRRGRRSLEIRDHAHPSLKLSWSVIYELSFRLIMLSFKTGERAMAKVKDRSSGVRLDAGRPRKPPCAAGFRAICRSLGEGRSLLSGAPANVRYLR